MEPINDSQAACRLGVRYPIIQGPFGGGISTARLTATVSNMGGLGSYGAHCLAPENIVKVVDEIRSLTSYPFAINLWVSDRDPGASTFGEAEFDRALRVFEPYFLELGVELPDFPQQFHHRYEDQIEALLEAGPPVFSFVFGVPAAAILTECKRREIATVGTATSIAEAQMLDAAGVDLIVATGFEAGGHRPSFLAPAEDSLTGTFALTQIVASRIEAPVITAGGIVDGRGIRAALALGAQAAQLGTAFLACEESGTSAEHRAILFSDAARETRLTRAYSGRLARGIRNRWLDEMSPRTNDLPPFPMQSWFVSKLKTAAIKAGRTDLMTLYGGQAAPNLRHRTAPALMEALVNEIACTEVV